jgi:hypothetical protein
MVGDNIIFTLCMLYLLHTGHSFVTTVTYLILNFIHIVIKNAADISQRTLYLHCKDQEGNAVKGHGCVYSENRAECTAKCTV